MLAAREFVAFGTAHLATLALIAVVAVALPLAARSASTATRRTLCYALAAIVFAAEIAGDISELYYGRWSLENSLPIHLCDIAAYASAVALFLIARSPAANSLGKRNPLFEACYFWGLGGTLQALLTPVVDEAFPHPLYLIFFLMHGAIIWSVTLMIGVGLRPRRGFVLRTFLLTDALAAVVLAINALLGTNYMYLCGPPKNPSLYDYFGPWPWSLLSLQAAGLVILLILAAPFARRKAGESAQAA